MHILQIWLIPDCLHLHKIHLGPFARNNVPQEVDLFQEGITLLSINHQPMLTTIHPIPEPRVRVNNRG